MSIDWASLVADAFASAPEKAAETAKKTAETGGKASDCPLFPVESGNKSGAVGTKQESQVFDFNRFSNSCSHVPTVPADFEEDQEADSSDYLFDMRKTPGGEEPQGGFAPERKDPAAACASCANLATPGLSSGYCGAGRADLAPAYGEGHPLRALPADGGEGCPLWETDWYAPRKRPANWGAPVSFFFRRR